MPNDPQYFFPGLDQFLKALTMMSSDIFWIHKTGEGFRTRVGPHGDMSPITFMAFKMHKRVIPVANWRQAAVIIGLPLHLAEQVENPEDERVFAWLLSATGLKQPARQPRADGKEAMTLRRNHNAHCDSRERAIAEAHQKALPTRQMK